MIKTATTFYILLYIRDSFSIVFWSQSKDFIQDLVDIQKLFVALQIDNMFVQPASESPLMVSDRAVYLAKIS